MEGERDGRREGWKERGTEGEGFILLCGAETDSELRAGTGGFNE